MRYIKSGMKKSIKNFAVFFLILNILFGAVIFAACDKNSGANNNPPETPGNEQPAETPNDDEDDDDPSDSTRAKLVSIANFPTDYVLEIPEGRDIKILQISDPQIMDMDSVEAVIERGWDESFRSQFASWENNCYKYIRYAVEAAQPDLILIAGDVTYGEFDDGSAKGAVHNDTMLQDLINFFDSLKIYWAPVFGNHDTNSSVDRWGDPVPKDISWMCSQYESAKYCLFKRRNEVGGNGNYSIAIKQGDSIVKTIYMLDSKGSMDSNGNYVAYGITEKQLKFFEETAAAVNTYAGKDVSSIACFHVPLNMYRMAAEKYGYTGATDTDIVIPANNDGDSGHMKTNLTTGVTSVIDLNNTAYNRFKAGGIDGFFVGHHHNINTSILYDGVRFTFGVKASTYAGYNTGELGGTLITLKADASFSVTQILYQ